MLTTGCLLAGFGVVGFFTSYQTGRPVFAGAGCALFSLGVWFVGFGL
jgi:hypothetical protein